MRSLLLNLRSSACQKSLGLKCIKMSETITVLHFLFINHSSGFLKPLRWQLHTRLMWVKPAFWEIHTHEVSLFFFSFLSFLPKSLHFETKQIIYLEHLYISIQFSACKWMLNCLQKAGRKAVKVFKDIFESLMTLLVWHWCKRAI